MSDRKVSTDALETLGTIIDDTQKRDAIHLAVVPVKAGKRLYPGQDISVKDGVACTNGELLGIVDPFLKQPVELEQMFWMVIYPRKITSLRHVWSHPSFPDEPLAISGHKSADSKKASENWLREFTYRSDCPSYDKLMEIVSDLDNLRDEFLVIHGEDSSGEIPPEFWDHVEVVTGKSFPKGARPSYFSCSC